MYIPSPLAPSHHLSSRATSLIPQQTLHLSHLPLPNPTIMATPKPNPAVATLSEYKAGKRPLPYWLLNVPEPQWPSQCPAFLTDISPRNLEIINCPAAEFRRLTWPEVQATIKANRIDDFRRAPLYVYFLRSSWVFCFFLWMKA